MPAPQRSTPTSRSPPSTERCGCSRKRGSSSGTSSATAARATKRRPRPITTISSTSRPATSSNSSMTSSRNCRSVSPSGSASASSTIAWSCTASGSTATAEPDPPPPLPHAGGRGRVTARAALRIAGLLLLGRSPWPRRFLAAAAWICGARVRTVGRPAERHTLLLANHSSWLDIMILAGATDCAFVAKDDLGHGLLHWLADQNATVYVRRSHVKGAKDQAIALAGALAGDKPVTVFP